MEKEFLTPGKLYAKLSGQLRARQEPACDGCRMPMIFLREKNREGSANWSVEPAAHACGSCQMVIEEIVRNHAARYDLWDPTAVFARRPMAAFVQDAGRRAQ